MIFKYVEKKKKNKYNLSQRIRYGVPEHETIDQLENVFVFGLENYIDQEFAKAYAVGVYDANCLGDRWDGDLILDEIVTVKDSVIVCDGSNGNPVMHMLENNSLNYEVYERTFYDEDGNEIVSSYKLLLVAPNASGFDNWAVLNSLNKETKELKL